MIAVHGLGYVGLTAAIHWAKAGRQVVGYDPDERTVERLRRGNPRAGEFLGYVDGDVGSLVRDKLIVPTTRLEDTNDCLVHSIAVPTEKNGEPHDAIILPLLRRLLVQTLPGTTILVESTLTPGTIDVVLSGLPLSRRYLAVCPRRDWFADASKNLETLPRIVGGVTPECTARARELLLTVSKEILTTDYRTAELTKAMENALLHVMVMMPTQLAINRSDLNVAEALELASTHWRLPRLFLGAGTGGRCVPLGSKYLRSLHKGNTLLKEAIRIDDDIRVEIARSVSNRGAKTALVLGVAYRPDFRDAGSSPGLAVANALLSMGVRVSVADPMWAEEELRQLANFAVETNLTRARDYDSVVMVTPHSEYLHLGASVDWRAGQIIVDAQGTWRDLSSTFKEVGVHYCRVGMAGWIK